METTAPLSRLQRRVQLETLLEIAKDLTASLAAADRYGRLLHAVRRAVPCDAACLLRLEGRELVPVAGHGLIEDALSTRYALAENPRLDIILRSHEPVRFPPDSALEDPFDGMMTKDPRGILRVHACLGCALHEGGEVVGALTMDALDEHAFDHLDSRFLAMLGALAGAAMRTTSLIEALERRAEHESRVARELQRSAGEKSGGHMLGSSFAMKQLREEMAIVATSDLAVLVTGETGVGKELVVRQLHNLSPRHDAALIHVNCAALPESIAESELFGHVAGAFTGAIRDRAGKFEVAHGGTLFLDEIGELPRGLQPKLLRALQQGEIQRIGSDKLLRVDVRVVAATNRNLEREVERGNFRADLYHRLAVFPLRVPPLRDRREDIAVLSVHFAESTRRRLGTGPVRFSEEAQMRLARAAWPGNVRELENVVSRAVLRASFGHEAQETIVIDVEHLDLDAGSPGSTETSPRSSRVEARPLRKQVEDFERRAIRDAIAKHDGNWAAAARDLGMHRSNLHHLADRLGIRR